MYGKKSRDLQDVVIEKMNPRRDQCEIAGIISHNYDLNIEARDLPDILDQDAKGIVALHQGYAIGFFFYYYRKDNFLMIPWFTVTEHHQQVGVEETLTDYLLNNAEKKGIKSITASIHEAEDYLIKVLHGRTFYQKGRSHETVKRTPCDKVTLDWDYWLWNRLRGCINHEPFEL